MPTFFRRPFRTRRRTGLATVALELAGAAAAVAMAVAAVASPLGASRPPRRPATGRPAPTLMHVPTQRSAPPDA